MRPVNLFPCSIRRFCRESQHLVQHRKRSQWKYVFHCNACLWLMVLEQIQFDGSVAELRNPFGGSERRGIQLMHGLHIVCKGPCQETQIAAVTVFPLSMKRLRRCQTHRDT